MPLILERCAKGSKYLISVKRGVKFVYTGGACNWRGKI
jgi:hypothetical protein